MSIYDLFSLKDQTAIVSGGARGLGAQMSTALAEAGANIVVCSRKLENCEAMCNTLEQKYNVDTLGLACDITNPEDIKKVVSETKKKFGSIDILINNSGATWAAPVLDMPLDAWNKVLNVNITGTYLMSREVAKHMVNQEKGKIINLSSIAGFGGTNPEYMDTVGYNTSKGAIMTLTKDLATKLGKYNINVNALAPGFFPTKMSQGLLEAAEETIINETPLKRLGSEEDIKGPVLFLASQASNHVSGDILTVDGGGSAYH